MSILWLAFGIYIVGVAFVLFIRPSLMFRPGGGTWKEFGLSNNNSYTVFPFWMFIFVWAIISYAIATLGSFLVANLAIQSMPSNNISTTPLSTMSSFLTPVSNTTQTNTATRVPGYYVLETPSVGVPRYVYYGTEPPKL